jgi:hypothetical protein
MDTLKRYPIELNIYNKKAEIFTKLFYLGKWDKKDQKNMNSVFSRLEKSKYAKLTKKDQKILEKYFDYSFIKKIKKTYSKIGGKAAADEAYADEADADEADADEADAGEADADEADADEAYADEADAVEAAVDEAAADEAAGDEAAADEAAANEIIVKEMVIGEDIVGEEISLEELDKLESEDKNIKDTLLEDEQTKTYINITPTPTEQKISEPIVKFIFGDFNIYNYDKIIDFKRKLAIITGIPIYKQHIFTESGEGLIYDINLNQLGTIKKLQLKFKDIVKKAHSNEGPQATQTTEKYSFIGDVPISQYMINKKNFIEIIGKDDSFILNNLDSDFTFGLVNLDQFIPSDNTIRNKFTDQELDIMYSGFIKFIWPMFSNAGVWRDYIKDPNFNSVYRELSRKIPYSTETNITDSALMGMATARNIEKNVYIAITRNTMCVDSKLYSTILNLRNVFDNFVLDDIIVSAQAFIYLDNRLIQLNKVYMNNKKINLNLSPDTISFKIKLQKDREEYIYMIIGKTGNYSVKCFWSRDNYINFTNLVKTVRYFINEKIVKIINKMDISAIHQNFELQTLEENNYTLRDISLFFTYRNEINSEEYENIFKKYLETYIESGLMKKSDRASTVSSTKRKKISDSPAKAAEEYIFTKCIFENVEINDILDSSLTDNTYDYYTNLNIKLKWDNFINSKKFIQIAHKVNDISIEVNNIREQEFQLMYIYLIDILNNFEKNRKSGNVKKIYTNYNTDSKKISNLRNIDPVLYDFKKLYSSPIIYSKLCQKPFQPVILTKDKYENLRENDKKRVVEFWNYTQKKPTKYYCPSNKYPFISFITNKHPLKYCIPCCKKNSIKNLPEDNLRKIIYSKCIADKIYEREKKNVIQNTKYIMAYGKQIPPGRVSHLPAGTLEPLFYELFVLSSKSTESPCYNTNRYYIIGMDQSLGKLRNVGFINIAVGVFEKTLPQFIEDTISLIKKNDYFLKLFLGGALFKYFISTQEFLNGLSELAQIQKIDILSNKSTPIPWNDIFQDILFYYYQINTIIFQDYKNQILLNAGNRTPPGDCSQLLNPAYKNLIVIKRIIRSGSEQEVAVYHPIYYFNHILYFKTMLVEKKIFESQDSIMKVLCKLIQYNASTQKNKLLTLSLVNTFCKQKSSQYKITNYFINQIGKCYYIRIKKTKNNTEIIDIPVIESGYDINELESEKQIILTPYNPDNNKLEHILNFIASIKKEYEITIDNWILLDNPWKLKGRGSPSVIGFRHKGLDFFHKPISVAHATKIKKINFVRYLYHPVDVNKYICASQTSGRTTNIQPTRLYNISWNLYSYYLYQLFTLQYSMYFNQMSNVEMRRKIKKIITKLNKLGNIKTLNSIISLIEEYYDPEDTIEKCRNRHNDVVLIKNMFQSREGFDNKKKGKSEETLSLYYLNRFNKIHFYFDNYERDKLFTISSRTEIKKKLDSIGKKIFKFLSESQIKNKMSNAGEFSNIITPCLGINKTSSNSELYCVQNKLYITSRDYKAYIELLIDDIQNPFKNKWIFSPLNSQIISFLKFRQNPGERITISLK